MELFSEGGVIVRCHEVAKIGRDEGRGEYMLYAALSY
jgi:hypothetical protein